MPAPLAEPSPDTHLTENVELSECLSCRDPLCVTSLALELWGGSHGVLGMSILASLRGKSARFPRLNEGEQAPRFGVLSVMLRAQEHPCVELPKGSGGLGMPQGMARSSRWVLNCVCSWFCTLLVWQPGDNVHAMAWTLPGWPWALWAVLFKTGSQ